jgi:hypothetical protein
MPERTVATTAHLQVLPNPTAGPVRVLVDMSAFAGPRQAYIETMDAQGRAVQRLPLRWQEGPFSVEHVVHGAPGLYTLRLVVDGRLLATARVVKVE